MQKWELVTDKLERNLALCKNYVITAILFHRDVTVIFKNCVSFPPNKFV